MNSFLKRIALAIVIMAIKTAIVAMENPDGRIHWEVVEPFEGGTLVFSGTSFLILSMDSKLPERSPDSLRDLCLKKVTRMVVEGKLQNEHVQRTVPRDLCESLESKIKFEERLRENP